MMGSFPGFLTAGDKNDPGRPQVSGETLDPETGDTVWIKVRPDGSRISRRVGKDGKVETTISPETDSREQATEGLAIDPESGDIVRAIYTPPAPGDKPVPDASPAPQGLFSLQGFEIRQSPDADNASSGD